jgi:hypothetical protein
MLPATVKPQSLVIVFLTLDSGKVRWRNGEEG